MNNVPDNDFQCNCKKGHETGIKAVERIFPLDLFSSAGASLSESASDAKDHDPADDGDD